jgi:hypothetical protein
VIALRRRPLLYGFGLVAAAPLLWFALGMHEGLLLSGGIRSKVAPWAGIPRPTGGPTVDALSDPVWQFVPWIELARRELRAGRAPLWNPHQDGGEPLLGNAQSALGSPLLWPALAAGVAGGWNLSLLLRILVALACAWLWLRDLGRSGPGALLGAIAFALSGPFVAWLEHPETLTAAAVPLLLLFVRRAAAAPSRGAVFGLAVSTAFVLAGGHPETQLVPALLGAAVAVHASPRPRAVLLPLGAACIGAGLAAPLLLPFAEYLRLSEAWRGLGRHPFVLSGSDLVRFLRPHLPGSNVIEAASTVSVTVLLLALAGLARVRRDREIRFWAAVAATILVVTYDNPIARALALDTPVHWTRALLFLPLPLGFLASDSLDRIAAAIERRGSLRAALATGAAVVAIASAELLAAARGVHGRTLASELRVTTPLLDRLAADPDVFRVLPLHTFLPPNSASVYGLDDVRGYDALAPLGWREQRRAIGIFRSLPTQTDALEPWDLAAGGAGLDFWNVKYLLLDRRFAFGAEELNARRGLDLEQVYEGPDGRILRNRRARPRVRLEPEGGTVRIERREPGAWSLDVSTVEGSRLILADPFFPGWKALLDGRALRIEAKPGAPMEMRVPPGSHRVEVRYRPLSWRVGWAIALAAAVALAVCLRPSGGLERALSPGGGRPREAGPRR